MSQNRSSSYSWTVVIIALILFWPLGVILLISKLANDKSANFGSGAGIVRFMGWLLVTFGIIMLLGGSFSGDFGVAIFVFLLFVLPGGWLNRKSRSMRSSGEKYRKYIDLVINNKVREVSELARRTGNTEAQVISDINDMINRGMLGAARLNLNTGIIQFPRPKRTSPVRPPQTANQMGSSPVRDTHQRYSRRQPQSAPQNEYKPFEPKTIRCKNCSANNFVEELPAVCDYCGSSLHV